MIGEPRRQPLKAIYTIAHVVFATRTLGLMWFDLIRLRARLKNVYARSRRVPQTRLHVGCGANWVDGWLNVDVARSEWDIDLAAGRLPWRDDSFSEVVSQHVIEHLELFGELLPLLEELRRVLVPAGEMWLSCPDMEKLVRAYAASRMEELRPELEIYSMQGAPVVQLLNDQFHQWGQHKNLFDFELLTWALKRGGFKEVNRVTQAEFRRRFPEFPARNDNLHALYVRACAP